MAAQLRAVRKLGVYPRSMREVRYDQTAVDLAAEAIDLLIERDGTGPIWHIMNPNVSTLEQLTGAKMVEDAAFAGKHDIPTHGDGHFGAQGAAPCFFVRFVAYCHTPLHSAQPILYNRKHRTMLAAQRVSGFVVVGQRARFKLVPSAFLWFDIIIRFSSCEVSPSHVNVSRYRIVRLYHS